MPKPKSGPSGEVPIQDKMHQEPMEDRLDEELAESFPASDPPSVTRSGATHEEVPQEQNQKPKTKPK